MFTIEQIKAAHSKVRTGIDFPSYVKEMKSLGVLFYEHFVSDGHIQYHGSNNFILSADAKWAPVEVAERGNKENLKHSLLIHQQGQTDYLTFCRQSAEAGVEKWIVDMQRMTCTYYDKPGNEMLVEDIPTV
ncbi:DUF1398 domain-containing protein [Parafilimonas terrae]|jgi:uncharacterized protein YbcV (DUF1398 family)|uniref:Uncharacterized conserved protein YbcV, DUF1398 family n=1 Tax=Parafilimonas terrae TaxID=1465490 RepID=A0A1I5XSZ9_9BACT|nr:DUF1398 family protein [Parafilimonas terrae]SFQ35059.1 Uncharacterized conserved protein YbcV, DUF1398 family [Parafilimonas terrae]